MPRVRSRPTSEPPIPPQPLPEPVLPPGHRAIPLYRKIGGSNRHPQTFRFAIVAYAIVDEADFDIFSNHRWHALWNEDCHSYVPARAEKPNGKTITIYLAREILDLPRNPGRGCDEQVDHLDHDRLNNPRANLRIVTPAQNTANQRRRKDAICCFRGIHPHGSGYRATFAHNGSKMHHLPTVPHEAEAAFMFNHVVSLLRDSHAQVNNIPPHQLPPPARQLELVALVESKLHSLNLLPVAEKPVTSPGS